MNPVLEAVEKGHYQKEVTSVLGGKRLVCRTCADDMPCAVILKARSDVRRQYGELRPVKTK